MKITIGTQDGNTHQKEAENVSQIFGKKIGENISGDSLNLPGYELEITGGSDKDGFPMKESHEGTERRRALLEDGTGLRTDVEGERQRKSIRGNTVSNQIEQLNTKVVETGEEELEELV